MKNGDKPAYPELKGLSDEDQRSGMQYAEVEGGLTKRERFAMAAMQATISGMNVDFAKALNILNEERNIKPAEVIAEMSVSHADALLEKLEES